MERVILSYPRIREGLKIVIIGIPGMLLIGFKNKRENLVKFGPIIALTLFLYSDNPCKLKLGVH